LPVSFLPSLSFNLQFCWVGDYLIYDLANPWLHSEQPNGAGLPVVVQCWKIIAWDDFHLSLLNYLGARAVYESVYPRPIGHSWLASLHDQVSEGLGPVALAMVLEPKLVYPCLVILNTRSD